jgi:glycosyltransferase involved in cell wall biosynthesis
MTATNPHHIGDLLVLVLGRDTTLRSWMDTGAIDREAALYERMFARGCYSRMVVVSLGTHETPEPIGRFCDLIPEADADAIALVSPAPGEDLKVFSAEVASRVLRSADGVRSAVVKTDQMEHGGVASLIASRLGHAGIHTALISRGGEHQSRKKSVEQGPASPAAIAAGLQEDRLCRRADLVVGTTHRMIDDLCWRHGIPRERARVVPNYVVRGPDPEPQEIRDRKNLLCVGPLIGPRRTAMILDAMAHGPAEEGAQLTIIGTGAEERALRARAKELGVKDHITFAPPLRHADLAERMYADSIYIQVSSFEGHPKTLIEAMYRGMACVVTRSPGLSDTVQHGVLGLVVEPNAEALGMAVAELMRDDDWRGMLAAGASRHVAQAWGLDRVLGQEIEAHRYALHNAATRPNREHLPEILWDKMLLTVHPRSAADVWSRAIGDYAMRLGPMQQAKLAAHLADAIDAWRTAHPAWHETDPAAGLRAAAGDSRTDARTAPRTDAGNEHGAASAAA